jgi:tetratricopeptide (TPR) repeat protein
MQNLGQVSLDNQRADVVVLKAAEAQSIPLDQRVLMVASSIYAGEIVICELDLPAFLWEKDVTDQSHNRKAILQAMAHTGAHMQAQVLADSIEDVGILQISEVPQALAGFVFGMPAIVFIPRILLRYLGSFGIPSAPIVSADWKANTIDVFELESRFDGELQNWQMYDSSRFINGSDPARDALASALGMQNTIAQLKETYFFGRNIGRAIAKEHAHQWLATDLKLEHFIPRGPDHVGHVDHSNDVMLLRDVSAEECAKSIAPLYQQMNYPLWHAFREGYWETRRRDALAVLVIFDGDSAAEILAAKAVANSREARAKNDWIAALGWCEDAEDAIRALRESDRAAVNSYLCQVKLIRGDIYLYSEQFEQALEVYDNARRDLELLEAQGFAQESSIIGALINSGSALISLGRPEEARERLDRGRALAEGLPNGDSFRQAVRDITSNLLRT